MKTFTRLLRPLVFLFGLLFGFFRFGALMADPAPDPNPVPDPAPDPKTEPTYTKADLDRVREEERKKLEAKSATEKKKADEAALTEQAKYKELAEQRGTELEQLRADAERGKAYAERLNTSIETEIKDWPKEVKDLDPGSDDLTKRLDWVEKSRPLTAKLKAASPPKTELGGGGKGAGSGGGDKKETQPQGGKRYRFQNDSDVSW